jgi:hypothetical protein
MVKTWPIFLLNLGHHQCYCIPLKISANLWIFCRHIFKCAETDFKASYIEKFRFYALEYLLVIFSLFRNGVFLNLDCKLSARLFQAWHYKFCAYILSQLWPCLVLCSDYTRFSVSFLSFWYCCLLIALKNLH